MNEMKDQLNAKMGDISSRAIRVQHQVNLKKNQRPSKLKVQWGYYATMVAFIGVLVLSINLFSSPFTDDKGQLNPVEPSENAVPPTDEIDESAVVTKGEHHALLTKYFFEDETEAVFEGGFENGGASVQTFWLNEHYVQQIMSNNGGFYERMYRLSGDQIELVYDEMINEMSPTQWEMADLEKLPVLDVILKAPFKVGESFGNWTVADTKEELTTSYGNFKNVVVVGSIIDDVKITKYFAQGFGEVKVETATFNLTTGVFETIMSMELASVEQMVTSFNYDSKSLLTTHTYYNTIHQTLLDENLIDPRAADVFVIYLEALKNKDFEEVKKYSSSTDDDIETLFEILPNDGLQLPINREYYE